MGEKVIYTSAGEVIDVDEVNKLPLIATGSYGTVRKIDEDRAIKVINVFSPHANYNTICSIKNLRLPNFYYIYDVLSCPGKKIKTYAGMICSFHQKERVDIWSMPSSFIIENYQNIQESAFRLGEKGIEMVDVLGNMILNYSGITIIDADFYRQRRTQVVEKNLEYLDKSVFYYFLNHNFQQYYDCYFFPKVDHILQEFFLPDVDDSMKKNFVKTLSKYPRPIDYLFERCKK